MALGAAGLGLAGCGGNGPDDDSSGESPSPSISPDGQLVPDCVLTAEQEEGPYYVDGQDIRENIVDDQDGLPLTLRITVVNAAGCGVIPGAAVDVWHCNAAGDYSKAASNPDGEDDEDEEDFLRGIVITGADGVAEFTTIFPGWYSGRTTHIHVKVHMDGKIKDDDFTGGHVSHTGQMFFEDSVVSDISALEPYASHTGDYVSMKADPVYSGQGGDTAVLVLNQIVQGNPADGYLGELVVGIDPTATPDPAAR